MPVCFFYCAGPAVNGFAAGCLLWFVVDKGCISCLLGPGPPGFSSLCLSYRFCPVKPLALFLKKKRTARPRPGHGGVGRAGIPSVASLFGGCTGPLRRPKKRSSLAATPPATTRPLAPIARRAGLLQRSIRQPGQRRCRSPAPRAIWFQHRCKTTNPSFAQGSAPANPPACQLSDGGATIPPPATLFGHTTRPIPAAPLTLIARRAGLLKYPQTLAQGL